MMTENKFLIQENRMRKFLKWLRETVHSTKEITHDEYEVIFNKVKDKAVWKK